MRRPNGHAHVEVADGTQLPLPTTAAAQDGRRVIYGIRPEHLELGGDKGVPAKVTVVEPTGPEILVFSKIGGTETCAEFKERHQFSPGQEIRLTPRMDSIHLFDAGTGKRLRTA